MSWSEVSRQKNKHQEKIMKRMLSIAAVYWMEMKGTGRLVNSPNRLFTLLANNMHGLQLWVFLVTLGLLLLCLNAAPVEWGEGLTR